MESGRDARGTAAIDSITIGIVPRERFSTTAQVIESVLRHTEVAYELIFVDGNMPACYRREVDDLLALVPNSRVIRTPEYVLPNHSKALVAEAARTRLTCLLENDCLVSEGWLTSLIAGLAETGASVAAPMVEEAERGHGLGNLGDFMFQESGDGTELKVQSLPSSAMQPGSEPRLVQVAEAHCLLFETEVLQDVEPFDPSLNTREFLDMSLRLRERGVTMAFQPRSRVRFLPPPPVAREDRPFFFYKWDRELCDVSHRNLARRWRLNAFPDAIEFVRARNYSLSASQLWRYHFARRAKRRIRRVLTSGALRLKNGRWRPRSRPQLGE